MPQVNNRLKPRDVENLTCSLYYPSSAEVPALVFSATAKVAELWSLASIQEARTTRKGQQYGPGVRKHQLELNLLHEALKVAFLSEHRNAKSLGPRIMLRVSSGIAQGVCSGACNGSEAKQQKPGVGTQTRNPQHDNNGTVLPATKLSKQPSLHAQGLGKVLTGRAQIEACEGVSSYSC